MSSTSNVYKYHVYIRNKSRLKLTNTQIINIINKTKNFCEYTDNLFSTNNILKMNSLIKFNTLKYMYDLRNNNPINLSSVHIKYKNKYKLRNKPSYKIPFSKSTQLINNILITGPKLWNNLPNNINNIQNQNQYKKN